jgi:hypothetical protein
MESEELRGADGFLQVVVVPAKASHTFFSSSTFTYGSRILSNPDVAKLTASLTLGTLIKLFMIFKK